MRQPRAPAFRPRAAVATLLGAVVSLSAQTAASQTLTTPEARVDVRRTAYGVPHITAPTYESLAYGVAYAHAQDNVCQTANELVTIRGQRSLYFGGAATAFFGLRMLPNEQIDLFVAAHMDDAALARAHGGSSASAQAMARGYVAGYNRYLQDTGISRLPAPCTAAPWVKPMTLAEFRRLNELLVTQTGVSALADAVLAARRPGTTVAKVEAPLGDPVKALAVYRIGDPPIGSNGWAFGRNVTANARGVLMGNPHFPWMGANRFWQMHLTIPGQLDVMGASIGYTPVVQIGFNRNVAWTHTVSTGTRFTLRELTLSPTDPTSYSMDGTWVKMVPRTLSIQVRDAAGVVTTKQHTVWRTVWGPVLAMPAVGLNWTSGVAYAIQDANTLNARTTDTWLGINRATHVGDIVSAQWKLGIPWVNTMAADRAGTALYADQSVVPDVNGAQLQRCAPSPAAAKLLAAGLVVLNGSRKDCDWYRDPTSAVPGLTPLSRQPVLMRTDWVQNSNDSYWLANPAAGWTGISPLFGPVGVPQRLRTRAGIEQIGERLAGRDGLAGTKVSPQHLQAMLTRNRNMAGALVMNDLLVACQYAVDADARLACGVLTNWDRTSNAESVGAALFREFWRRAGAIPQVWAVPFDPLNPVKTPRGLNVANLTVRTKILESLTAAVKAMRAAGFSAYATLGSAQHKVVRGVDYPLHGGEEFEGVLNKVEALGQPTINVRGYEINSGSSYMQTVTFDDRGPVAQGLLTYGQSSNPASPRSFDQLAPFSRKQWPALPFHSTDVVAAQQGATLTLIVPAH